MLGDWEHDVTDRLITARVEHDSFPGRTFELLVSDGGEVLRISLEVDPGRRHLDAITTRQLHEVPLGALSRAVRRAVLVEGLDVLGAAGVKSSPELKRRSRNDAAKDRPRRRRREELSDAFLAEIARDYLAAAVDDPATALEAVGMKHGYAAATIRSYRDKARARGLFESKGRGVPGGHLTPQGEAALKEAGR